jgi:hypothetical protein
MGEPGERCEAEERYVGGRLREGGKKLGIKGGRWCSI